MTRWRFAALIAVSCGYPAPTHVVDGGTTGDGGHADGGSDAGSGPSPWVSAADLPAARSLLGAIAGSDGDLYIVGGYDGFAALATTYRYALGSSAWMEVTDMPTAREAFAAVAGPDGRIYTIGGTTPQNIMSATELATVEAYTPSTFEWATLPSLPSTRDYLAAASGSDRIYAIGGNTGFTSLGDVDAYAPGSNSWTLITSLPTARSRLAAVTGADGRIYTIGGFNDEGPLATVEAYTPSNGTWQTLTSMPTPRTAASAVVGPDGRIFMIGGRTQDADLGQPVTAIVEAYTPSTDTWATLPSLPAPRADCATVLAADGRIYVIGGTGSDGSLLATVEAYAP